jgi:Rap guanine nucleotide exchange factor 4
MYTTAEIIKAMAADKLKLNRVVEDLVLVEVKSNGERSIYKDNDVSVATKLQSLNGRLFVTPKEHLDALVSD